MSKLDSKPKHVANIPLTPHDLSHTLDYTSSTGMLLPVCTDLLNPGEKITINVDVSETRTMPVASAAFADIDIHVDYFFVPMTLLYSPFESFIYQINNNFSDVFDGLDSYWNQLPLMSMESLLSYISTNRSASVQEDYGYTSTFFDCEGKGAFRLLDHFGMNPFFDSQMEEPVNSNVVDYYPSVFPWQILAYNAIFQYYYRLDDYERFQSGTFNVDSAGMDGSVLATYSMVKLHYRPNYMDYFNSVKNSPLVTVTNVAAQPNALPLAKSWLSREGFLGLESNSYNVLSNGDIGSTGYTLASSPNYSDSSPVNTQFGFNAAPGAYSVNTYNAFGVNGSDINTANIRAMFANEKLWQITGAARKTYDAQTLAHYGFNVPTDIKHQVTHIGHDVTPVRIGEVISTAGTDDQPLGTVAGKGYAANVRGGNHQFTAPCHGVLMAITSAMVRTPYIAGFDKINAIANWQDFYQPEFDHLGMQPMFRYEALLESSTAGNIIGWQYRYEQFKRKYDRCTRAFGAGYFNTWTPVMSPFNSETGTNDLDNVAIPTEYAGYFYQPPTMLNNIMVTPYTVTWSTDYVTNPEAIYETDPLVTHAVITYKKLSTMSAYSMPRLDA